MRLWREEFPIDSADERYVTRRQFGRFLVLTSLGMFAGSLWILARSLFRPKGAPPPLLVGRASAQLPGSVRVFQYPEPHDDCVLFRMADGRFVAYSQKCTHLSCAVFPSHDGRSLECPCHDGLFSMEDGRVVSGPPPRPLPRILLEQRGDALWAVGIDLGTGA
jgi:nitrite reductase/ring-hydroxylating ferredoxin subunit